jgi:6-phosphogluconolactonase (cycloisomerase 2 family)
VDLVFTDLDFPTVTAVDPANRFVFVYNGDLNSYRLDPATNLLQQTAGLEISVPVRALAVDPTGRFLIAACACTTTSDDVFAFAINQTTGALLLVGGVSAFAEPTSTSGHPIRLAMHRSGMFLYASASSTTGAKSLSALRLNPLTGVLSLGSELAMGGPFADIEALTVDPLGRFLFQAQNAQNAPSVITTFTIDGASGALTATQSASACPGQCFGDVATLEGHPTGRYLLSLRPEGFPGEINSFEVNAATGALTYTGGHDIGGPIIDSPFFDAFDTALESSGRFLYVSVSAEPPPGSTGSVRQILVLAVSPLLGTISSEVVGATVDSSTSQLAAGGPIR